MKKQKDYKVTGGKLLRVEADLDNKTINSIKISGDFFIHPETALVEIEYLLKGIKIIDAKKRLSRFIQDNNIQIIGFEVLDLCTILEEMSK